MISTIFVWLVYAQMFISTFHIMEIKLIYLKAHYAGILFLSNSDL